jgi:hypothetical protein
MVPCFSITNFCMLTNCIYVSCIILSINRKPGVLLAVQVQLQLDWVVYEHGLKLKIRSFATSAESVLKQTVSYTNRVRRRNPVDLQVAQNQVDKRQNSKVTSYSDGCWTNTLMTACHVVAKLRHRQNYLFYFYYGYCSLEINCFIDRGILDKFRTIRNALCLIL